MATIGFIGIGKMGLPMARNLIKAGHDVTAFDLVEGALAAIKTDGAAVAPSAGNAAKDKDVIVTMLPAGKHVKAVYENDLFGAAKAGALMIDCSTIDVETARAVHEGAAQRKFLMLDSPVSGGVGGAEAGTLTMMVGGAVAAFEAGKPYLDIMGANVVHCGGSGNGQAAKICNNMMLGIQMASVAEAFVLAEKLGLAAEDLFKVSSKASGQCWSLTTYCPVPGLVPTSPANRDYNPGFGATLMLKDMRLALEAAKQTGVETKVAARASKLYDDYIERGGGETKDFSGIINLVRANSK